MFRESGWRLVTQVVITMLALLASVVVNRLLGPTNKGAFVVVNVTVAMIVQFGNLGVAQAVAYHAAKETFALEHLWAFVVFFGLMWGLVLGAVGLLVVSFLPLQVLRLDGLGWLFLTLGALTLFSELTVSYLRYYVLGTQRFALFNGLDLLRNGLAFALPCVCVFLLADKLLAIYVSWILVRIITFLVLIWGTRRSCKFHEMPYAAILAAHLKYGVKAYVAGLLQFLNYRLDQLLLNLFLGPTQVGLYSIAVALGEYIWQMANAVQTVLLPKVAAATEAGGTEMTVRANRNTLLISGLAALALAVFGYWIILVLYGEDYLPAYVGLLWLLPGIVAFATVKIQYTAMAARGSPEVGSYITGGALVATLLFDFLLIPRSGLVGAAQASSIAYTTAALVSTFIYVRAARVRMVALFIPTGDDLRAYVNVVLRAVRTLVRAAPRSNSQ